MYKGNFETSWTLFNSDVYQCVDVLLTMLLAVNWTKYVFFGIASWSICLLQTKLFEIIFKLNILHYFSPERGENAFIFHTKWTKGSQSVSSVLICMQRLYGLCRWNEKSNVTPTFFVGYWVCLYLSEFSQTSGSLFVFGWKLKNAGDLIVLSLKTFDFTFYFLSLGVAIKKIFSVNAEK